MSTEGTHAAAAAAQLFDVLGEAAVHWPAGVEADAADVTVIVDRTQQAGEFASIESGGNRKLPRRAEIELLSTVVVTTRDQGTRVSVFVLSDDSKWYAEKHLCVEDGIQTIACTSPQPVSTSHGSKS